MKPKATALVHVDELIVNEGLAVSGAVNGIWMRLADKEETPS